ncbi:hypothetical protein [Tardiphaga robiniae]|uniref:hypothetical protein n=1 Tax=Tardiphaga robiniae TaxID=943830 RepID=UPI0015860C59|nr:hypothetical protein [Tardiphaga robiniae]NUU41396.1 hypothetical protein [Tardiphaga robiniae]
MTGETRQSPTKAVSHEYQVGDLLRDTYYDNADGSRSERSGRTIRIMKVGEARATAKTIIDGLGREVDGRTTTISFKTLRTGYEPLTSSQRPSTK